MRKFLTIIGIAAGCVVMVSGTFLIEIEGRALSHPDHATALYTEPLHLKGVIRYVTPDQKRWDHLADMGFFGGWLVGFTAGGVLNWLMKRTPKL
jgi:hypothetical protein